MGKNCSLVGVLNRKGGTGKTTLAVNLAAYIASRDLGSVVLVDADPQGSAAAWLGDVDAFRVVHEPDPEKIGAAVTAAASSGARFVIVDGPPFDATATKAVLDRAALAVVPVCPSPLDLKAALPLLTTKAAPVLAVLTMTVHGTTATDSAKRSLEKLGVRVAETDLRRRIAHVHAAAAGVPVTAFAPGSLAAAEVRSVGHEVIRILSKGKGKR